MFRYPILNSLTQDHDERSNPLFFPFLYHFYKKNVKELIGAKVRRLINVLAYKNTYNKYFHFGTHKSIAALIFNPHTFNTIGFINRVELLENFTTSRGSIALLRSLFLEWCRSHMDFR